MKTYKLGSSVKSTVALLTAVSVLSVMPLIIEHMTYNTIDFGTVAQAAGRL